MVLVQYSHPNLLQTISVFKMTRFKFLLRQYFLAPIDLMVTCCGLFFLQSYSREAFHVQINFSKGYFVFTITKTWSMKIPFHYWSLQVNKSYHCISKVCIQCWTLLHPSGGCNVFQTLDLSHDQLQSLLRNIIRSSSFPWLLMKQAFKLKLSYPNFVVFANPSLLSGEVGFQRK